MKRFGLLAIELKSTISINFAGAVRYVGSADTLIKLSLKKCQSFLGFFI